jgi:hypothetical protein
MKNKKNQTIDQNTCPDPKSASMTRTSVGGCLDCTAPPRDTSGATGGRLRRVHVVVDG